METEPLLHATRGNDPLNAKPDLKEEEKVFDSFLDMTHATMLNIENEFKEVSLQNDATE